GGVSWMRSNDTGGREAIRASSRIWKWRGRRRLKFASTLRRRRRPRLGLAALGLQRNRSFADHLDQRLERFGHAVAGRSGEQKRRLLRGAFQAIALLLQFVRRIRVDLVQRHDLDLVGEMSLIRLKFGPHRL